MVKRLWDEIRRIRDLDFDFLIFFVTGQCNALCHHCFYWENLGPAHVGLALDKLEKLASTMPQFRTLLLSGGEPSLRKDLPELVDIFRRHNAIRTVSVPTNGLLPERIATLAEGVARLDPALNVTFNLSIDGFAETHDQIRGVPGNFAKSMESARRLREVAQRYPNLQVIVNTVICADNYEEVVPFAQHCRSLALFDNHFFEIVRGDPPDKRVRDVPPAALRQIYDEVLPLQKEYLNRGNRRFSGLHRLWRQIEGFGGLIHRYQTQWSVHSRGARWSNECVAGEAIAVIDYDGRMRVCELREANVDLAAYDFDFESARASNVILSERKAAKSHTCDCTHVCFVNTSLRFSLKERFLNVPLSYLRYSLGRGW